MQAVLRKEGFEDRVRPALAASGLVDDLDCDAMLAELEGCDGVDMTRANDSAKAVEYLAARGLVEFRCAGGALTLTPIREDFGPPRAELLSDDRDWKLSRFQYQHMEEDVLVARSPNADCFLKLHDPRVSGLIACFARPLRPETALQKTEMDNRGPDVLAALARAGIILPCDSAGQTEDETLPNMRMWDFHDLLFHSRSRLGRSGYHVGATYAYQHDIPQPPLMKTNPWAETSIPLYRPTTLSRDMSLFDAMETRRSIRKYSVVPLSATELGEFLFRTMRIRSVQDMNGNPAISRPYPNGGAIYEQELYLTIDSCLDIPRGFYYYDALNHSLHPVSAPCPDMEMMLEEAVNATARTGRPQILFTIASRFDTFNWKYSAMSYAAQLKNIGVIYQTMYLVTTAMGLGGCGLGLGNSDRFAQLTGIDYAAEGSIGEFMIGRPI